MKKRYLRKLCFIMAAILSVSVFSACGEKATDKDEQGRTVISIGNYPSKEGETRDIWDAKWKKFEEDNPDVKIEPDMWEFDIKTFYAKEAGGKLPNLFISHYTEIGQYIDSECVGKLTDVMKKRGYEGKFNPKILKIVSDDKGDIYAFPTTSYLFGLYVNMDTFKEVGLVEEDGTPLQPKTWDELAEYAVKIKEKTGKPGFAIPTTQNCGGWMFTCIAWGYGTVFMEQGEDGKWKATFNSPEAEAALQYIKDLKWKYDVLPANSLIDYAEYFKLYATGGVAMIIGGGSSVNQYPKYGMQPASIGIVGIPAGPKRHVTLLGGTLYAVSKESTEDQKDAAIRWLETSFNYNATEDFKANKQKEIERALNDNQLVGVKTFKPWSNETESVKFENELIDKNRNVDLNNVRLYNEFIENCPAEIQPEEPVCAQELYAILDGCIQEVLTNKDANCKEILEKANYDFQQNYLDNL